MTLVLRPQLGAGIENVCVRQAREDDLPALEWKDNSSVTAGFIRMPTAGQNMDWWSCGSLNLISG